MRPLALLLLAATLLAAPKPKPTALDRYIAQPDPSYTYSLNHLEKAASTDIAVLDMTSQTWRTTADVSRPQWQHAVVIYKPAKIDHSTALLFIDGGSNNNPLGKVDRTMLAIANASHSVVVQLRQVPNEPLRLGSDTFDRNEDGIIAYTWHQFLKTGDDSWPLRLPMTKAAVRAMDTTQDFCRKQYQLSLDHFVVAGASKRGWTTWTTAAVDPRVVAFAPLVIDVANFQQALVNHYRAYGFYAPAVNDYVEEHITDWLGTPQLKKLQEIEDPYFYRARYTMPKYIVNSAGDQFFPPDSSKFYFSDLPGEKYLRYIPNSDHSLKDTDAAESIAAWYRMIITNTPRPRFSWTLAADGTITVTAPDAPAEVKLWQATNPKARDFRLESLGPKYTATPVTAVDGKYSARAETPAAGFTASFLELTYQIPGIGRVKFTTAVAITPDKLPFDAPKPPAIPR